MVHRIALNDGTIRPFVRQRTRTQDTSIANCKATTIETTPFISIFFIEKAVEGEKEQQQTATKKTEISCEAIYFFVSVRTTEIKCILAIHWTSEKERDRENEPCNVHRHCRELVRSRIQATSANLHSTRLMSIYLQTIQTKILNVLKPLAAEHWGSRRWWRRRRRVFWCVCSANVCARDSAERLRFCYCFFFFFLFFSCSFCILLLFSVEHCHFYFYTKFILKLFTFVLCDTHKCFALRARLLIHSIFAYLLSRSRMGFFSFSLSFVSTSVSVCLCRANTSEYLYDSTTLIQNVFCQKPRQTKLCVEFFWQWNRKWHVCVCAYIVASHTFRSRIVVMCFMDIKSGAEEQKRTSCVAHM